ncbi:peptidoglycan D,D-transpeptidase FtsI family protein [Oceanibacterium hippocampi]|uniref:Peptidoglycan synthase FtsI n=1 Tax=Oceanibacterium hippocampi TaxID=745714 RepID=A0A1Y5SG53_9PROT|nr:penicillin-binding protein 2 [Oceanibacterium hippocampi]SLN37224.1 Peptidoglycan synthase FtsI [Oceanibacterium hippocampi]
MVSLGRSPDLQAGSAMALPPRGRKRRGFGFGLDPNLTLRLEGGAKATLEQGRNRVVVAGVLFAVCFSVIAIRLVGLTLMQGEDVRNYAAMRSVAAEPTRSRAAIYDRNGKLLAANIASWSLYANPRKIDAPKTLARSLNRIMPELSLAGLEADLSSDRKFIWIKRHLTPRQRFEVNRLGEPGLEFEPEERRVYPQGRLVSHVVGFTDVDNHGIAGIERTFDGSLTGERGGEPVTLSLDLRVQHALRDELLRAVSDFQAVGATGVVMDVLSGEVLAMVSLPDFDPNKPQDDPKDALFNRATAGVYEMGSTFKTFTIAMALDLGVVGMENGYDASKPIRVGRFRIRDFHAKNRWLSVPEIYMYSSNIGAAKMAIDVGIDRQQAFMGAIGLLDRPALELPEVAAPILPPRWKTTEAMTISFGHGLSVSPLQTASAVAAMVNGGVMLPATLIRRDPASPLSGRRVISQRTSEKVRRLMRLVVDEGTGGKAAAVGYVVGGKTGSAEKAVNGRYKRDALLTSFIAAFPMNSPRYLVFAMLDEPQGNKSTHNYRTAGWTAAPIVGRTVARIAPILGVEPADEESPEIRNALLVKIKTREGRDAAF